MKDFSAHIIRAGVSAREGLKQLGSIPEMGIRTLFVVDHKGVVLGSLTDGDIRRGLLDGREISERIEVFVNRHFRYLDLKKDRIKQIKKFRELDIHLVPVLDRAGRIKDVLDLNQVTTILPLTGVLMAGGKGERLRPYTNTLPKPMLQVGDKPIIEHNLDRWIKFGIEKVYISVNYKASAIMDYFGDGRSKGIDIEYLQEKQPLGTMGALSLLPRELKQDLLVMNADLLTNLDYEDFYQHYIKSRAPMCVATVPYTVQVPYAVLEYQNNRIKSLQEKPSYSYYSNGGIYLISSALRKRVPQNQPYQATELIQNLLEHKENVSHYPIRSYWLDIGKPQDFMRAQEDIKHVTL